jgi:hypothetical protein
MHRPNATSCRNAPDTKARTAPDSGRFLFGAEYMIMSFFCPLAWTIRGLTSNSINADTVCINRPIAKTTPATASMSASGPPRMLALK